ncbi:MAG: MFS transporter [Pseudomonadota bacterium]
MQLLPMMAALFGLGFANIFLRATMGVLAPELARELSLTPAVLGATASAFFVSYALLQIPSGIVLDRFGPRDTLIATFTITLIGTCLFATAESAGVMLFARLLMGAGCAAVFAAAFMLIARFYPADRLTSVGGTMNSFAMVGTLMATAPLAALVGVLGWRLTFAGISIGVAGVLLLVVLFVRDHPRGKVPRQTGAGESVRAMLAGSAQVLRTPGVLPLASAGIALSAGNTLLGIWGGPYLNDVHGLDPVERGTVLAAMAGAGVAGHFLYGQAARWFNTLKWIVVVSGFAIVGLTAALALLPEASTTAVTVVFALLGLACSFPTILLAHARALVPDHLIGRGITTVNTGIMVAIAVMQLAVGAIIGWWTPDGAITPGVEAYQAAFTFQCAMAAVSTLIYLRVRDCPPFARS